jgi:hypothetical protein
LAEQILPPLASDRITNDGVPTEQFFLFLVQVAEAVKPPITGSGTPQSNVIATVGRFYVDIAASAGTGIYFKQTGEGNTGWVLRS